MIPSSKRFVLFRAALVLVLVAMIAGVVFVQNSFGNQQFTKLRNDPDAGMEASEQRNRQAAIGNQGESLGGPASAEEEKYAQRAYPASDVPFALTQQARAAFEQVRGRGKGKNSPGTWTLYGPSQATVPAVLGVYGGVDSSYVTSGRVTSLAIDPKCGQNKCRLWVGAAGGGVWRTDNALSGNPKWTFISAGLPSNAIGSLQLDPTDSTGNTIYVGTGEANASSDSEAGVGLFKSTDGGNTWNIVGNSKDIAYGRSIGSIAINPSKPSELYIGTTRGVRGVSSVSGGATTNPPVAAPFGLYKSTDGGKTFKLTWAGNGTIRGVRRVILDPLNPNVVYASAYQQGLWRSNDSGATWEQIYYPVSPLQNTNRTEFDVTVKDGHTRIYVADGSIGPDFGEPYSRVFRADAVDTKTAAQLSAGTTNAGWKSLTSDDPTSPYYGTYNFCTGQCWYDSYITTPKGHPDVVYVGGSHQYGEIYGTSNGRGVVMSTNGGESFTDMTVEGDATEGTINLHPDHHFLVTHPGNPSIFFSASDGGVVRSSGSFVDVSAQCATRGLSSANRTACERLLSRVPERLISLNTGLSTLQFQSLSADPRDHRNLIGGTQDNGTWQNNGSSQNWGQTIYGDGGQSGFDAVNPAVRFNTFFNQATDVNFQNGDPSKWVVTSGPLFQSGEGAPFYMAIISDPKVGGTMFAGLQSVWRTKKNGGDQAFLEANCSEFTTSAANPACGDWARLGSSTLTAQALGNRGGGTVAAVERTKADSSTLWAATSTGRVFVAKNADAEPAGSVAFDRIDDSDTKAPNRFVSSIYVDPTNANRAWISYGGYSALTPTTPGHVFEVVYNPAAGTATWTNLDGATGGPLGDLPVTDLVRDDVSGDLYAATDFGVHRLAAGEATWTNAGAGLPVVEVAGLTIVPQSRVLYAATHGRSAWALTLP